jgi:CubicO group peptidase (beta-lactamase class C family)
MRRIVIPLLPAVGLLLAAVVGVAGPKDEATLGPAFEAVARKLDAERATRRLPSLSVAVVRGREIVLARAFGTADLERSRPAAPEMIYPAGSITKVLVATAMMQLVERGVVRLDDPITKYLPEYRVRSPWPETSPATLRQLASHTAGLPRDAPVNFWMNYSIGAFVQSRGQAPLEWYVSKERLLESLPTVELDHEPDTDPQYSNLGMALLAMALERASGRPFAEYVAREILGPLGMRDSTLAPGEAERARMPVGYVYLSPEEPPLIAPEWRLGGAVYTGGLYTTASDLARFLAAHFPRDDGAPSPILSQQSLRQMRAPVGRGDAALGWWTTDLDGRQLVGHTGGHLGFLASIAALPDLKLGIAIMTNSWNPVGGADDTWELSKMALADLADVVAPTPSPPPPFDAASVDLTRYPGHYALSGGVAHVDVALRNGKLRMSVREKTGSEAACEPTGPGRFSCGLEFRTGKDGAVTGLSFALFDFRREATGEPTAARPGPGSKGATSSAPCDTPTFVAPPAPPPPEAKADPFGALSSATCDPPLPTKKTKKK